MRDLSGGTAMPVNIPANMKLPTYQELEQLAEEIKALHQVRVAALRKLFELHGFDLANGDVLIHAPDVCLNVPPEFAHQVRASPWLEARSMWFRRSPAFLPL